MRKRRLILGALALLSLAIGALVRDETTADVRSMLQEIALGVPFPDSPGPDQLFRSPAGEVAFRSYDLVPSHRGYAGPIKLLVVLGPDGRIRGLRIIEHRETRNYVHYLETPAYLNRFIGKSVLDRFAVDQDVDGISRATVSVEALARTLRDSSRMAAERAYGLQVAGEPERAAVGWGGPLYGLLFLSAAAGYVQTRRSPRWQLFRDGVLIASIVIAGWHLSAQLSILHVFNLALCRPSSSVLWYLVVGGAFLSLAVAGRFYCGWLCPFGALAELIGRIPARKWTVPAEKDAAGRELKYLLLGAATAAVLVSGRTEYGNYEAYVTLFALQGTPLAWLLVLVTLAANLRIRRFWCRYLCPVAALTAVLSRSDPAYISRDDCPMGNKPHPETAECIRCNRCYQRSSPARIS
jgi:hypothetical protein